MAKSLMFSNIGKPSLSTVVGDGRSEVLDMAREGRVVHMLTENDRASGIITREPVTPSGEKQPPSAPDNKDCL